MEAAEAIGIIRTPNPEKLSNRSLVEGLSDEGVTSQKYLNMDG